MQSIEKILLGYDPEGKNILPALKEISAVFGFVSREDAAKVAEYFSFPLSKIYETASFYDMIKIKKQPRLTIKVCSGTHCAVSGASEIIREIENLFRISAGDEFNPKVALEVISCLGQCGEGPVVVVNGRVFTRVTASSVHELLEEYL